MLLTIQYLLHELHEDIHNHHNELPGITVLHVDDSVQVQITATQSNVPRAINVLPDTVISDPIRDIHCPTTTNRILLHPYFWSNCYGTTTTASDSRFPDDIALHNS